MENIVIDGLASWQVFVLQLGIIWGPLALAAWKQNGINKQLKDENKALRVEIVWLKAKNAELEQENDELRTEFINELRKQAIGGRKGI